ncbi:MAG: TonB C-terminal domain-containing protein [Gemmatimonadetes bacterium]|nr:TonB C-terminal domain-containing protein [Gemmatimonadota bacterium]
MTGLAPPRGTRLTVPLAASAALHVAAIALLATRPGPPPMPPMYEVNLVAAPAGPRSIGSVAPAEAPAAAPPSTPAPSTPAPSTAKSVPLKPPKVVKKAPPKATPAAPVSTPKATPAIPTEAPPTAKAAPTPAPAGGGPTGDKGTDVATVRTEGTAFPFPGYLQNIVRQIALNFRPRAAGALRCDVAFLIHRDGSVTNVRFVTRSGAYAFDLEAQGAIEAASRAKAFGPLPAGFADDVLPVTFSFDPRLVR